MWKPPEHVSAGHGLLARSARRPAAPRLRVRPTRGSSSDGRSREAPPRGVTGRQTKMGLSPAARGPVRAAAEPRGRAPAPAPAPASRTPSRPVRSSGPGPTPQMTHPAPRRLPTRRRRPAGRSLAWAVPGRPHPHGTPGTRWETPPDRPARPCAEDAETWPALAPRGPFRCLLPTGARVLRGGAGHSGASHSGHREWPGCRARAGPEGSAPVGWGLVLETRREIPTKGEREKASRRAEGGPGPPFRCRSLRPRCLGDPGPLSSSAGVARRRRHRPVGPAGPRGRAPRATLGRTASGSPSALAADTARGADSWARSGVPSPGTWPS